MKKLIIDISEQVIAITLNVTTKAINLYERETEIAHQQVEELKARLKELGIDPEELE